ncbi:MAG: CotH kinase family protein [Lacunisphaera sp.]
MKFTPFIPACLLLIGTTLGWSAEQVPAPADPAPAVGEKSPELRLVGQFDKNGDQQLDATERAAARAYLAQHPESTSETTLGRPGSTPPVIVALEPSKSGTKVGPADVTIFAGKPLYDETTLRTIFLEFEDSDWEKELGEFARTDINLPAHLTLDGQSYSGIGVHFHDRDSTATTPSSYKRALDLTIDPAGTGQTIDGERRLRLVDASTDATYLRTMLYMYIARQYLKAPQTNFVQVVINGENWGTYVNVEPFDDSFIRENFATTEGAWWSVTPGGNLAYLGDKPDAYRQNYMLKSKEDANSWNALIDLCKILNNTPPSELEAALSPRLDIDNALRFLALENVLINQDGYGATTGGYGLYLAKDGRFQFIPQYAERSFRLVEESDYERGARRTESKHKSGKKDDNSLSDDPVERALQKYNPKNFPHQNTTDLAMLLSYSFVNKADSDFDGKISRDEWQSFARGWFLVMDEDLVGKLTRNQFLGKFRAMLTPASIADGRTKQTFGPDDAAAIIGADFFKALDQNHDGVITSQEVTDTFAQWFTEWSNPKTGVITEPALRKAFDGLFTRTIFLADQSFIARNDKTIRPEDLDDAHGRGRGRGHGGGNGIGLGPLHFGAGHRGGDSRTLVTFSEELDALNGLRDDHKPLIEKLLTVPALRTRYLAYVREITENWLTWEKLGPVAQRYHDLIAAGVEKETHKANSYVHFVQELDQETTVGGREGGAATNLKSFITERHHYLLDDDNVMGVDSGP